jgi:hypothetical protein
MILEQNAKRLRPEAAIRFINSSHPVHIREVGDYSPKEVLPSPPLPADPTRLTFEFPDNSVVVQDFPGNVTLGFVCASLGSSRGVLFDRIKVEADDSRRVGEVPDIENLTFRVTAPFVSVSWELLPDKKPKGTLGDISIFARVIDVKHQIAKSAKLDFFRCQLLLDNALLDDWAWISS